jgi:hypothetical protein
MASITLARQGDRRRRAPIPDAKVETSSNPW